jgi:hypothetical protein
MLMYIRALPNLHLPPNFVHPPMKGGTNLFPLNHPLVLTTCPPLGCNPSIVHSVIVDSEPKPVYKERRLEVNWMSFLSAASLSYSLYKLQ